MPEHLPLHVQNEDATLVRSVLNGNTNAFKRLIHQYEKLVCSIVFRMVDQKEDREDICHEVFLKVYDKLSTFRFQSKLSTWIGNIAFNQSVNFLQKKKALLLDDIYQSNDIEEEKAQSNESFQLQDHSKLPDELLLDKERIELLAKMIEMLSPLQRTVLILFHQHELSLEEISNITSLPVNTVKSHLFRGRQILKTKIETILNK